MELKRKMCSAYEIIAKVVAPCIGAFYKSRLEPLLIIFWLGRFWWDSAWSRWHSDWYLAHKIRVLTISPVTEGRLKARGMPLSSIALTHQPSLGCHVFRSTNVKSCWCTVSEAEAHVKSPAPSKCQRSQRHQVFRACHIPRCKYNCNLLEYLHWTWSWDETCRLTSHNVKGPSTYSN